MANYLLDESNAKLKFWGNFSEETFTENNITGVKKERKIQNEMETPDRPTHKTASSKWDHFKFELNSLSQSLKKSNNPLPQNPTNREKLRYACSCPPHGKVE